VSAERIDFGEVAAPHPRQPQASRVQAPVDIFLDGLALSIRSLDLGPSDTFDCFLAVEFAVEVLGEYEILLQVIETPFERPLEYFGFRKATGFSNFSHPVGDFGGHTERLLGNVFKSVSARPETLPTLKSM